MPFFLYNSDLLEIRRVPLIGYILISVRCIMTEI